MSVLECIALLISTSTNFLQPSQDVNKELRGSLTSRLVINDRLQEIIGCHVNTAVIFDGRKAEKRHFTEACACWLDCIIRTSSSSSIAHSSSLHRHTAVLVEHQLHVYASCNLCQQSTTTAAYWWQFQTHRCKTVLLLAACYQPLEQLVSRNSRCTISKCFQETLAITATEGDGLLHGLSVCINPSGCCFMQDTIWHLLFIMW